MIWLTWRQHRKQVLYTAIGLVALGAVMLPTGLSMHHVFTNSGLAACLAKLGTAQIVSGNADTCGSLSGQFSRQFNAMGFIAILFLILPGLVGLFYGAPLVSREVEQGTHRFVWTQTVSRRRWAVTKFGLIGAITLVFSALYTLGMDWWSGPLTAEGGRMGPLVFDFEGVVPIGYTLFAVSLGIFAGTLWKKVLPAMGVTLTGFVAVRVLIETLARSRYMSPLTASLPITGSNQFNNASGAWIYTNGITNGNGRLVLPNTVISCGSDSGSAGNTSVRGAIPSRTDPCNGGGGLLSRGLGPAPFSNSMQYQPASRFWEFQGIETGIFLALAAILVYLAIRRLRQIG
jgi:ABC-type transport system involved in multi-copper enzyme maturation permease subunit